MSPASKSKSKSKEKHSSKTANERQKGLSKSNISTNTGNNSSTSAYNPVSGTFHSLDTIPLSPPSPVHGNGRFQNIDESDDHSGSSNSTATEYDSLSNNGSCSGESEDHKEKLATTTPRPENIPGSDNDKREKIRQKNERKHQRQRERRAHELHERCSGYLMSRKLTTLSQQLVAMGFSSEKATLALMLNEGRIQESVNWLFEGNEEEAEKIDAGNRSNLDISEELARITALEIKYKRSKQEVERAVVAFEGDLEKAEEMLQNKKPEPHVTPPKAEETPTCKHLLKRLQEKPASNVTISYTTGFSSLSTLQEPGNKNSQSLKTSHLKSYSSSSSKISCGNESRSIQQGTLREPVIMIQRPQSLILKQNPVTNHGWYPNDVTDTENTKLNTTLLQKHNTRSYGASHHFCPQVNKSLSHEVDPALARLDGSSTTISNSASSPSLTVPSSLGLFSGWGSSGTTVHVDWNARDMMCNCDYTSIDWTLELNKLPSRSSRLMIGFSSMRIDGRVGPETSTAAGSGGGPREWTTPFAGKDIFSVPRQFVTSPAL